MFRLRVLEGVTALADIGARFAMIRLGLIRETFMAFSKRGEAAAYS